MPEAIEPAPAGTAPRTVLRLAGITKRFGGLTANDAVSLELRGGEILALLGENGAGKTTLMSILFGHYVADAGSIEAFGRRLPAGSPRAAIRTDERRVGKEGVSTCRSPWAAYN